MKGNLTVLGWFVAALVGPVQNIYLLTGPYFTSFVPIAQQAKHAVLPRRLSLKKSVSG
jgi:hypothetical protein